jgi:hypothetical protein
MAELQFCAQCGPSTTGVSADRPHINYGTWDVFPGQTYVQLATQHIHDWVASYVAA